MKIHALHVVRKRIVIRMSSLHIDYLNNLNQVDRIVVLVNCARSFVPIFKKLNTRKASQDQLGIY